MLTETLGLFPKSATLVAVLHLGASWLLADTFSERLAERKHIPACVAGVRAEEARARHGLPSEQEVARGLFRGLLKAYPELGDFPGVGDLADTLNTRPPRAKRSGALARCRCLASVARSETAFDHTLWVATLKFYEPDGVRNFEGVMARAAHRGDCGRGDKS